MKNEPPGIEASVEVILAGNLGPGSKLKNYF
jgi:hypothetical protein